MLPADATPLRSTRVFPPLALAAFVALSGCVIDNPDYATANHHADAGTGEPDADAPTVDLAQPSNAGPDYDVAENVTLWGGFESNLVGVSFSACPKTQPDSTYVTVAEDSYHQAGQRSIRVEYGPGRKNDFAAFYPKTRSGDWDVTRREGLSLFIDAALPAGSKGWSPSPTIVLCTTIGYRKIEPLANLAPTQRSAFIPMNVPLDGNANWTATDVNLPDLHHVTAIELHFQPASAGPQDKATAWLDDVRFY